MYWRMYKGQRVDGKERGGRADRESNSAQVTCQTIPTKLKVEAVQILRVCALGFGGLELDALESHTGL